MRTIAIGLLAAPALAIGMAVSPETASAEGAGTACRPSLVLAQSGGGAGPVDPAPNPGNPDPTDRNPIDPKTTIPEKMPDTTQPQSGPAAKGSASGDASETLSETLSRTDGVLKPPATGAPDMRVPAPVPDPNTTPVIPPPGAPGSGVEVRPK